MIYAVTKASEAEGVFMNSTCPEIVRYMNCTQCFLGKPL
jgi:hypothetical protein